MRLKPILFPGWSARKCHNGKEASSGAVGAGDEGGQLAEPDRQRGRAAPSLGRYVCTT